MTQDHATEAFDTVPLPRAQEERPVAMEPAPRRRRRRWLVIIAIIVVLATAALVITEVALRQIVPKTMADLARDAVGLSEDHPVDIDVAGYLTPQVLFGRFQEVRVSADNVPLAEGIRASVSGVAHDLPRDVTVHKLGATELTAKFTEEQLISVLHLLSRGIGDSLEIEQEKLTISHEIPIFGQSIPISVAFLPSVVDGKLHIDPISVDAAGVLSLTVEQLASFQLFAPYADGIDVCVAEYMPAGATLDRLAISTTKTLAFTVTLDPRIGIDEALQHTGTCD